MSTEIESSEQKIDLSKLGQFYSPIDFLEYGPSKTASASETNDVSPIEPKKSNNISTNSPNINLINNKKKLKVKFKKISTKANDSFAKKTNNSYNISRNDNNLNEITTTISTIDDKTNITNLTNSIEEKSKINKLKELMICYICHERVVQPKICPLCFKIACEECIKRWFLTYNNKICFCCKKNISIDKMINIPVINNISNILNKKTIDVKNDSSLVLKQLSSRINKVVSNKNTNTTNIDSSRSNISNFTIKNVNNSLDLRKCLKKIKHRKFPNSISETRKANIDKNNTTNINQNNFNSNIINSITPSNNSNLYTESIVLNTEHCDIHKDQYLFYYCVNCEKSYCRTCFVFFGEEKNKHIGHKIIDYEKLKDKSNFELFKEIKDLKEKSSKINNIINKCENLKNCYNIERNIVNRFIKSFINNYNEKIDSNIKLLNDVINNYKNYLEQMNKERNNIKQFYLLKNNNNNIIINNLLNNIKKLNNNITNLKDIKDSENNNIDLYPNLSPKFFFNVYHTDLKQFNIIDNNYKFKTKLNNSKYNLVVLKKEKEVQIYIYYPVEKKNYDKRLIVPYIYLKKKDKNWELLELKEALQYNGHNYYIKRFNSENFCEINSCVKIKGVLYESFFM